MGIPDCRKSFKIGLAILIQYQRVTDKTPSQPHCRSKYRTYYVTRVKRKKKRHPKQWQTSYLPRPPTSLDQIHTLHCMQCVVIYIKCHPNWLRGYSAVWVENGTSPLLWTAVYTTACTTVQAVMVSRASIHRANPCEHIRSTNGWDLEMVACTPHHKDGWWRTTLTMTSNQNRTAFRANCLLTSVVCM